MARVISRSGSSKQLVIQKRPVNQSPQENNNNKVKKTQGAWEMSARDALKVNFVDSEI